MPSYPMQIVLRGRLFSTIETRNIYYVDPGSEPPVLDMQTDIAAWLTSMYSPITGVISNLWHTYQFDVNAWDNTHHEWVQKTQVALGIAGGSSSEPLPSQMAVVAIAKTGLRRTFARKFLPGLTETQSNGLEIVTSAMSVLVQYLAVWLAGYEGIGRYYVSGTWTKNNTFVPFTMGVIDSIMGTMRRRKQGVGV